jgi:hypothetical protein
MTVDWRHGTNNNSERGIGNIKGCRVMLKLHCTSELLPAKGSVQVFTFASSAVLYGVCARREQDGGVSPVSLRLLDSPPQR